MKLNFLLFLIRANLRQNYYLDVECLHWDFIPIRVFSSFLLYSQGDWKYTHLGDGISHWGFPLTILSYRLSHTPNITTTCNSPCHADTQCVPFLVLLSLFRMKDSPSPHTSQGSLVSILFIFQNRNKSTF